MRYIAAILAIFIALTGDANAQLSLPNILYQDAHWLLTSFKEERTCMLIASQEPKGSPTNRNLMIYVSGRSNAVRIELPNAPKEYLASAYGTTVSVDLGPRFTRQMKFYKLVSSRFPTVYSNLTSKDLEDIRAALETSMREVTVLFPNGEKWRFPPPESRRLASVAAECWKGAAVVGEDGGQDSGWRRCLETDPDAAIAGCSAIIQSGSEKSQALSFAYARRGAAYWQKHQHARAIPDLDQAIRLDSHNDQAFLTRGTVYLEKGEYNQAIQDFDSVIRLDPTFFGAFYNRGYAYYKKVQYDTAIRDLSQAIQLNPNYDWAFYVRGDCYFQKGQYDRAIQDYDRAIQINPSFAEAYDSRGMARLKKGDVAGGKADIAKAKQLNPNVGR